jgi:hypothetical protein
LVGPDFFFDAEADGLLVVVEEVLGWLGGVRGGDVPDEELVGVEAGRRLVWGNMGKEHKELERVMDRRAWEPQRW